jgi:hypothetical protein
MVFAGPAEWAEPRELEWERAALHGQADHDDPAEIAYLEDVREDRS